MNLILRASVVELVADADQSKRWRSFWLEVIDPLAVRTEGKLWERCVPHFWFMRDAVHTSIESSDGLNPAPLRAIRMVEAGELVETSTVGTGWIAHLTRKKVWFEGLCDQGEGGEVSFAQYKLAVETYVRFLADPEHKTIEVPFPEA